MMFPLHTVAQKTACPECGLSHSNNVLICDCGFDLEALRRRRRTATRNDHRASRQKHRFLAVAAVVFRLLAALVAVGGLYGAYRLFAAGSLLPAFGVVVAAALGACLYAAIAATITLLIELSADRRAVTEIVRHLQSSLREVRRQDQHETQVRAVPGAE